MININKFDQYDELMRREKLQEFKSKLKQQKKLFTKISQENEPAVHAIYVLLEFIAKYSKSFM